MNRLAAAVVLAIAAAAAAMPSRGAEPVPPPNLVVVDERITTSGQPSAEWLAGLKERGYEAVVYLAPATVPDAVRDEPLIVSRQGLVFVNIPIPFDKPTAAHVEQFAAVMNALAPRKVLVHCQVNLRASSMVFLLRAAYRNDDPATAYDAVNRVWTPQGPWKALIRSELERRGVAFDPF